MMTLKWEQNKMRLQRYKKDPSCVFIDDVLLNPYLPGIESELFKSYMKHELDHASKMYIDLCNKGMPFIGKEAFIAQYVDSGLARIFNENYGKYYGQVYFGGDDDSR